MAEGKREEVDDSVMETLSDICRELSDMDGHEARLIVLSAELDNFFKTT